MCLRHPGFSGPFDGLFVLAAMYCGGRREQQMMGSLVGVRSMSMGEEGRGRQRCGLHERGVW